MAMMVWSGLCLTCTTMWKICFQVVSQERMSAYIGINSQRQFSISPNTTSSPIHHSHAHTPICTHTHAHTKTHTPILTPTHTHTYTTHTNTHLHTHTHTYIPMQTHNHTYTLTYTPTPTNTYVHLHSGFHLLGGAGGGSFPPKPSNFPPQKFLQYLIIKTLALCFFVHW